MTAKKSAFRREGEAQVIFNYNNSSPVAIVQGTREDAKRVAQRILKGYQDGADIPEGEDLDGEYTYEIYKTYTWVDAHAARGTRGVRGHPRRKRGRGKTGWSA